MTTVEAQPIPPPPVTVDITVRDNDGNFVRFSPVWMQWFNTLSVKAVGINADISAIGALSGQGFLTRMGTGNWAVRTHTGTANRITVSNGTGVTGNPTYDISATYVGQASITTLGTIATGTWNGSIISITYGGTGASTAAGARTNLGATTVGANIFTVSDPSAITFLRVNADNTVSLLSGAAFITATGHETAGAHDKLVLPEGAEAATPAANTAVLYVVDSNGISELEMKDATGLVHHLGEELMTRVRNTSGSTLNVGEAVYISGSTGAIPNVSRARSDAEATLPCSGLVVESILNNGFGRVITVGKLIGVDTSAFAEGNILWLSATVAGSFTVTPPVHPNFLQKIGEVSNVGVGNGSILVAIGTPLRPLTQAITNGDTTHAPSSDAVFDAIATAGGGYQPLDATLTALAGQNWALNALPIGTGVDTVSQVAFAANTFPARASTGNLVAKAISDFGLSLVDDADAATARTTLGALASSAYTAADVLAKLLTVDGAGSGLDADLLDGQSSAYYTAITARLGYTPVNKAGDTMSGALIVTGDVTAQDIYSVRSGAATTGVIWLGNSGARYLFYDGTKYVLASASLDVGVDVNAANNLNASGNVTSGGNALFGGGTSQRLLRINGGTSGASGGSFVSADMAGVPTITIGNYSAIFGGAYDGTPIIYSVGTFRICVGSSTTDVQIDSVGTITAGDFYSIRQSAPTTGAIFFGNSGGRYLFYNGTSYDLANAALSVGGSVSSTQNFISSGGTVVLATTGAANILLRPNGAGSSAGEVTISSAGDMTVNGSLSATTLSTTSSASIGSNFEAIGTIKHGVYLVSTLPTGELGKRAFVSDASAPAFLAAVVGGGAVTCPVFHNGSSWRVG